MRKLCDRQGETLAETLCAVLVLALAVTLLAGMLSASFRLDRKTDQTADELYQSFSEAENPASDANPAKGSISVQIGEDTTENVPVEFYGNSNQAVSYRIKSEGSKP